MIDMRRNGSLSAGSEGSQERAGLAGPDSFHNRLGTSSMDRLGGIHEHVGVVHRQRGVRTGGILTVPLLHLSDDGTPVLRALPGSSARGSGARSHLRTAVRKNLKGVSGKTFVPISRPSRTPPLRRPSCCCN